MLIVHYKTKRELLTHIGEPLAYEETSAFGPEYKRDGTFVASNRPHITRIPGAREFFAQVTMKDGRIASVY